MISPWQQSEHILKVNLVNVGMLFLVRLKWLTQLQHILSRDTAVSSVMIHCAIAPLTYQLLGPGGLSMSAGRCGS